MDISVGEFDVKCCLESVIFEDDRKSAFSDNDTLAIFAARLPVR